MVTVPTTSLYENTTKSFNRLQGNLAELSAQISSGVKADKFTELGSAISRVADLEGSIKITNRYMEGNNSVIADLKSMDGAVAQLQEVATELLQNLVLKRSPSSEAISLTNFADAALDQTGDALNTSFNGKMLFSGSKTDKLAVDVDLLANFNVIDGKSASPYYKGDSYVQSIQASKNLNLDYGIKADEEGFKDLIGAINLAVKAEENLNSSERGFDDDVLEESVDMANLAVKGLASIRNKINTDIITLEQTNSVHKRVDLQFNQVLSESIATNIIEATTKVAQNEATLNALFQTFSRISNLSLVDYLR